MKTYSQFCIVLLLALGASQQAIAQSGNSPLVTVNGQKITAGDLNGYVGMAVSDGAQDSPELRQSILNDMILRDLVIQDVKKSGLLAQGSNAVKVKFAEQNAMVDLWFAQYFKAHPVTEEAVRSDYDRQVALSKEPKFSKEYQVAQIVVGSKAEADDLIQKINSGASFEFLAKEKSLDKASGQQGGVVGWARFDQMVAPINEIVSGLTKGSIAPTPIQTQSGWHIIKLDNIRPFVMPSFDQSKESIAQALIQRGRQDAIAGLMKNAKIVKPN
jgi:peptidyl-prolyl cis-trans isomerase C